MLKSLKGIFHQDNTAANMATPTMAIPQSQITVHKDTHDPTRAWQRLQVKQPQTEFLEQCLPLDEPVYPDKVRFVCMSDTHFKRNKLSNLPVPYGDVYIHTGDFTQVGKPSEVKDFNEYLGALPHPYKIVIAGNHDLTFDHTFLTDEKKRQDLKTSFHVDPAKVESFMAEEGISSMKEILTNCTYLEDSETSVYGIRIYGSPWQPEFCDWGFNLPRGQPCLDKWNLIPPGVDILLTHGPPVGHGDMLYNQDRSGCVELLNTIQHRVQPKYHVFGHIHEGYGVSRDEHTTYINASTCTFNYRPTNPPILFDIDLPQGMTKVAPEEDIMFVDS